MRTFQYRCLSLIVHLVFVAQLCSFNTMLLAQTLKDGQSKLMRGDYAGAESSLTKALKTARTPSDKAAIYKNLGITYFMQGKKPRATQAFRNALSLNPETVIMDTEVADESVIPFFNAQKSSTPNARAPVAQKPASQVPLTARAPLQKPGVQKKSVRTLVKVVSNVPKANVSIDGISYGAVGADIEVTPGNILMEVSAPGYRSKAIKFKVAPKTSNTVTANLEKIIPKAKPKPKPVVVANRQLPKAPKQGSVGLFDEPEPFAGDASANPQGLVLPGVTSPSAKAAAITPPPPPASPTLPPSAGYSVAPPQQPQYQQPSYPTQPYMQPQPYPMQPQPYPMQPQPYYVPPQPYYPQPPPSVYQPYSPPPPAYGDPYGGFISPPPESAPALPPPSSTSEPHFEEAEAAPPPSFKPPSDFGSGGGKKRSSKSAKKSSGSQCGLLIKLLPLGAGQFCQGSTFKGLLFAGAQIGGVYFYKANNDAAVKYQGQLDKLIEEREAERDSVPAADRKTYDQETDQKEQEGNEAITQANQNANMSLAVAGGAWAIGVIDAVAFGPTPKKSKKKARLSLFLPKDQKPGMIFALKTNWSSLYDEDHVAAYGIETYAGIGLNDSPTEYKATTKASIRLGLSMDL
jgi:hypothetical protein